eukprot:COSAG01_NODE_8431_length_2786_cov_4.016003_2_plen_266_part_00
MNATKRETEQLVYGPKSWRSLVSTTACMLASSAPGVASGVAALCTPLASSPRWLTRCWSDSRARAISGGWVLSCAVAGVAAAESGAAAATGERDAVRGVITAGVALDIVDAGVAISPKPPLHAPPAAPPTTSPRMDATSGAEAEYDTRVADGCVAAVPAAARARRDDSCAAAAVALLRAAWRSPAGMSPSSYLLRQHRRVCYALAQSRARPMPQSRRVVPGTFMQASPTATTAGQWNCWLYSDTARSTARASRSRRRTRFDTAQM